MGKVGSKQRNKKHQTHQSLQTDGLLPFMKIKSYESDRYSSVAEESTIGHKRNSSDQMAGTWRKEASVHELFKEVQRKMEGEREYPKAFKKNQECFYKNLKKRLQLEVKKSGDQ
jgi:hypothetical protein